MTSFTQCAGAWACCSSSGAVYDLSVYDNVAYLMHEHTDLTEEMIHDMVMMKLNAVGLRGAIA